MKSQILAVSLAALCTFALDSGNSQANPIPASSTDSSSSSASFQVDLNASAGRVWAQFMDSLRNNAQTVSFSDVAVPVAEPTPLALLGIGLLALARMTWRRHR